MSFSADKVNMLKGAFSQRRFSSSKDPSESGMLASSFAFSVHGGVRRYVGALDCNGAGDIACSTSIYHRQTSNTKHHTPNTY